MIGMIEMREMIEVIVCDRNARVFPAICYGQARKAYRLTRMMGGKTARMLPNPHRTPMEEMLGNV